MVFKQDEIVGDITIGDIIYDKQIRFNTGELPYTIMAESKNYIICQRPIDKKEDIDLLKHEVEMDAYLSVDSALSALKNTPVYTILDIKNKKRGPHNLVFNITDFNNKDECIQLLKKIENGDVELSRRNSVECKNWYITE